MRQVFISTEKMALLAKSRASLAATIPGAAMLKASGGYWLREDGHYQTLIAKYGMFASVPKQSDMEELCNAGTNLRQAYIPPLPIASHKKPKPHSVVSAAGAFDWKIKGPAMWGELHHAALQGKLTPQWLSGFADRIPCGECRRHFRWILGDKPLASIPDQFEWSWTAHELVNARLGNVSMTLEDARKRWA